MNRLALLLAASLAVGCGSSSPDPDLPDGDVPITPDAGPDSGPPEQSCTNLIDGFKLNSQAAVQAIAGCERLTGPVVVIGDSPASIELPLLRELVGTLTIADAPALTSFSAPKLFKSLDIDVTGAKLLTKLDLSGLREVTGHITLNDIPLDKLQLDNLAKVQDVTLEKLPVASITFPQLIQAQSIVIDGAPSAVRIAFLVLDFVSGSIEVKHAGSSAAGALPVLEAPQLRDVPTLSIDDVRLHDLSLPKLATIGQKLQIFNSSIDELHAPDLEAVSGTLHLAHNRKMPTLFFPKFKRIGNLRLGNPIVNGTCTAGPDDSASYSLDFPSLEAILQLTACGERGVTGLFFGGVKVMVNLQITGVPRLATLSVPQLNMVSGRVLIIDNPKLEAFEEKITTLGAGEPAGTKVLELHGNPLLACRAVPLTAAVGAGRTFDISGNSAACAP